MSNQPTIPSPSQSPGSPTNQGTDFDMVKNLLPSVQGMRKNGKQWHQPKTAFRLKAGDSSYAKRLEERKAMETMKAKEKEMKQEKEDARNRRIEAIRAKRTAKEEKARYEKMAETMHRKRVERLKRRENRNKKLKS